MIGYENLLHLEDQKYLFGTSSGYLIIDIDKIKEKDYAIEINVIAKKSLNEPSQLIDKTINDNFKNKENNISFNYNVTEYDKYFIAEYQYKLDGIYEQWSSWDQSSMASFRNLPSGDYTFNVRARVGNAITNEASYSFVIEKPWYLSNLMILIYGISIIIILFLTHTFYQSYYKKQRERLMMQSQQELELEKLENEQQRMTFRNEQLKQDIENKNRELAISTMSLIKKNEFLNKIKEELKSVDQEDNLKHVVKIIDKNLNNTDDWKFFQEAFNNADKGFLNKVKEKHPALTPNDLKLCAYLRLNLSSKEIAPLLNISSRSVEDKRYRLRKKMNLPHESSLTNYILEL
jgi:DNA-binding CsgD family transcriptional regulator